MPDDKILRKVANDQLAEQIDSQNEVEGYSDEVAQSTTTAPVRKEGIFLDPISTDQALYEGGYMDKDDDIIRSSESMPILQEQADDDPVSSVPEGVGEESWGEWGGRKLKDTLRYAANPTNIGKDILNKPGVQKFLGDVKAGYKGNTRSFLKEGGPVKAVGRYGGNVPGMKHGGMKK